MARARGHLGRRGSWPAHGGDRGCRARRAPREPASETRRRILQSTLCTVLSSRESETDGLQLCTLVLTADGRDRTTRVETREGSSASDARDHNQQPRASRVHYLSIVRAQGGRGPAAAPSRSRRNTSDRAARPRSETRGARATHGRIYCTHPCTRHVSRSLIIGPATPPCVACPALLVLASAASARASSQSH